MLEPESKLRLNFGIEPIEDLEAAKNFLWGMVYSWIRDRPKEKFAARDLVGGPNWDWTDTPMYCLYNKHIKKGKAPNKAYDEAAKDAGWLLKLILHEDKKRHFRSEGKDIACLYSWVGNQP